MNKLYSKNKSFIFYTAVEENCTVFKTCSQKNSLAYLVATQPHTAKIVLAGSKYSINKVYQAIPWPTYEIAHDDHQFNYKGSPSLQALEEYFSQLKEQ
ncbi:hypothetical protein LAV82_25545 [Bacillus sp. ILBB4]|nr:hypothetical protein [Bacillus sp. ILBB4]